MKYFRVLMLIVMVFAALGLQAGNANAATKFSYTSGIQIQNLADAGATVTLTYYDAQGAGGTGGGQAKSVTVPMGNLASATFFPIHADAGFKGSVVVSSSQPIASIVNLHGDQGTTRVGNASYVGQSEGATSVNLPLLHKGNYGFDSWFNVQNAGSGDAHVYVNYSDGTSNGSAAAPIIIKQGASYTFDQTVETHTKTFFSGMVTSDQPVIAVVVQEEVYNATKAALAYTGFAAADTDAVMPLINANNYGYTTGVQIQNTSAQDAEIEVTYTPTKDAGGNPIGSTCTEKKVIPGNGGSATFALQAFAGTLKAPAVTTCAAKVRFVGSARITSNHTGSGGTYTGSAANVVAVVNQQTSRSASAYGSFLPSKATNKVVFPLIMERRYGWWTGFNLQNVGTTTVNVKCVFTNNTYEVNATLAPGEAVNNVQTNKLADKYVGSGTCTATLAAGQTGEALIAGVVNETSADLYDNLLTYEGINVK